MSGMLVIPRKDARLAGVVMAPALIVMFAILLLTLYGHLIPGVARIFWSGQSMPSVVERLIRVQWLIAGACFVVPCWTSVAVALGDGARRAQYLATSVPAVDGAKAVSKVVIVVGCALLMWAIFSVASVGSAEYDGPLARMNVFQVLALALGGAACGLGAGNLVRRIATAGMLAMILPAIGLPIGQLLMRSLVALPDPDYLTGTEWQRLDFARNAALGYVSASAALGFAAALALFAAPMLAGRDTRPRVVRTLVVALAAAVAVASTTTLGMAGRWTDFGTKLATLRATAAERAAWASVTDTALIEAVAFGAAVRAPPSEELVLALAAGWPSEQLVPLYGGGKCGGEFEQLRRAAPSAALFQFQRLRERDRARLNKSIRTMLDANEGSVERRLAINALSMGDQYIPNLAHLLVTTPSELDRARIIVELAQLSGKYEALTAGGPRTWCTVLQLARTTLRCTLVGSTDAGIQGEDPPLGYGIVSGTDALPVIQAIGSLSRPMPALAERASNATPPASPEGLECIRRGLPPENER